MLGGARTICWLWLAAVIACVGGFGTARSVAAASVEVEPRAPLIVVRSIGAVPAEQLRWTCRTLLESYPVRCEIRSGRSLADFAEARTHRPDRLEQLDAREVLELMFRARAEDALVELGITEADIYQGTKPYVFGLASLTDRVAVISVARLGGVDRQRFRKRMHKLVLHEAAHALGLPHHKHEGCVMRQDPTPESLDTAPTKLCNRCHAELSKNAATLRRPGQHDLDRARGHLVRGEPEPARVMFVRTLDRGLVAPDLLRDFGRAFLEAGRVNEAISIYRYSLRFEEHPAAHVQIGVALQIRENDGDLSLAVAHFRRALTLEPGLETVAQHLRGLEDLPTAQGPH